MYNMDNFRYTTIEDEKEDILKVKRLYGEIVNYIDARSEKVYHELRYSEEALFRCDELLRVKEYLYNVLEDIYGN